MGLKRWFSVRAPNALEENQVWILTPTRNSQFLPLASPDIYTCMHILTNTHVHVTQKKQNIYIFACLCAGGMRVDVFVLVGVEARALQQLSSPFTFCFLFGTVFSRNLELIDLVSRGVVLAPHPPPLLWSDTYMSPFPAFMLMLGIQTQAFMLA